MPLHYLTILMHLVGWLVGQVVNFFARSVEVFLHVDFGKRYLVGRFGLGMLLLHATVMLGMGVVVRAPFELAEQLLTYDPSLSEIARAVDATTPKKIDMREEALELAEQLKDTYVTDEAVTRGSYYTAVLYKAAIESATFPFAVFVFAYLGFGYFHQTRAAVNEEVNEFAGYSHLEGLIPGVSRNQLTGLVEPAVVMLLGFVAWGQLPSSRLHFPLTLDADPVIGRFLLVSGLCLLAKEQTRLARDRQKQESLESRQRKMGRNPSGDSATEDSFSPVKVILETRREPPTVADAYAALPLWLKGTLTNVPGVAMPHPDRRKVACPHCGKGHRVPSSYQGTATCKTCGHTFAISSRHREVMSASAQ